MLGNDDECGDANERVVVAAEGLVDVIIYSSPDDRKKNRGFCFLEYETHKAASLAKRRLSSGRIKVWSCDVIVDWADPQEEPDREVMAKVGSLIFFHIFVCSRPLSSQSIQRVMEFIY